MKINGDFSICDRLLPLHNMNSKHKTTHAQISIGCKPSSASLPNEGLYIMVCTAKNRSGNKYAIKDNVLQIFSRFLNEGKLTIRLKKPEHDLIISKCDALELKCFLNVLKHATQGGSIKREHLSTLVPASCKDVTKAQTKMIITSKKEYPITSNFPKTLNELAVNTCNLKRFDARILQLKRLTQLDLSQNLVAEIPVELSKLGLRMLILSHNRISKLHRDIFTGLLASSLQVLDLSSNELQFLPPTMSKLPSLVRICLNNNKLLYLPYGLITNRSLKFFQATNNQLQTLSADFTTANLDELDLYGNPLRNESETERKYLKFPTLVELSARSVKLHRLIYGPLDLPRTLIFHLEHGRRCRCGAYCFRTFARTSVNLDLRRISREVVKLDGEKGYHAKVDAFLCSVKCLNRLEKNPLAYWRK